MECIFKLKKIIVHCPVSNIQLPSFIHEKKCKDVSIVVRGITPEQKTELLTFCTNFK
jgi:hypothetical protein